MRYGYDATFLLGALITLAGTLLFAGYVWHLRRRPDAARFTPPPRQDTAIIPPLVGQPAVEADTTQPEAVSKEAKNKEGQV